MATVHQDLPMKHSRRPLKTNSLNRGRLRAPYTGHSAACCHSWHVPAAAQLDRNGPELKMYPMAAMQGARSSVVHPLHLHRLAVVVLIQTSLGALFQLSCGRVTLLHSYAAAATASRHRQATALLTNRKRVQPLQPASLMYVPFHCRSSALDLDGSAPLQAPV